jgi:hypothetical protein
MKRIITIASEHRTCLFHWSLRLCFVRCVLFLMHRLMLFKSVRRAVVAVSESRHDHCICLFLLN